MPNNQIQNFAVYYFSERPQDFDTLMELVKNQQIASTCYKQGATDTNECKLAHKNIIRLTTAYEKIKANYEEWQQHVAQK